MTAIGLQSKTKAKEGIIEYFWFENKSIGLKRTMFHRIVIPLEPFDSGLDYVTQPEETKLIFDWINLGLKDPSALDGLEITSANDEDLEATVYLGTVHNWIDVHKLSLKEVEPRKYEVRGELTLEFEKADVAPDEPFSFRTIAVYRGKV